MAMAMAVNYKGERFFMDKDSFFMVALSELTDLVINLS